jgi:peptidoglycan/LPS O-acetylase OafA/YrhL
MYLASFVSGRDNNFNLIRILAALAVLVTHSFALSIGSGDAEPLRARLGMTLGTIAVDVFFAASGFLVTASLLRTRSIIDFVWARALRIFPGLIVMLLITVLILGFMFSTLQLSDYFTASQTYIYLVKCATLIRGVSYELPGVFEANPYKLAVNGSLWTMPLEIRLYSLVAGVWILSGLVRASREMIFKSIVLTFTFIAGALVLYFHFHAGGEHVFLWLFFMFFTGASFFILRKRILLSHSIFWLLLGCIIVAAFIDREAFFVIYTLGLAYLVFYFAYVPAGFIRTYNLIGDYSYGVYIYAFPVQQSIAASIPGISVLEMLSLSATVTLALSALSWHLLERRALAMKQRYARRTKQFLHFVKS